MKNSEAEAVLLKESRDGAQVNQTTIEHGKSKELGQYGGLFQFMG